MEHRKYPRRWLRHALSTPFIWVVLFPLAFFDFFLEIYHRACFPLYGIPYVKRSSYVALDRHKLTYLGWFEKLSCTYCSYANGILAYAVAIAGETEKYWCGIKSQEHGDFRNPPHRATFAEYGDEKGIPPKDGECTMVTNAKARAKTKREKGKKKRR